MANIGNITANIGVNTAGLRRGLSSAQRSLSGFTKSTTKGFAGVATSVVKVTAAITALGATVGTALAIKGIREFIKFEDALLELQKVMNETEGDARQFISTVEKLSNTFGESAAEVLQGAANFRQAGFTVKEAFELQEVALRAATVSNLDVVESSQKLIRILKGFRAPASEAARVLDIMNEVSNKFATNLGELAIGMADLSPVARLMGFTFEETAAILTPIIEVFGSGSEAAVAMRTSLLRLVSDQDKVIEELDRLKVSQRTANGQLRQGRDILFDLAKAFQRLEQTEKLEVAARLVGIRQGAKFVEVVGDINKVLGIEAAALDSTDSALREQDIRLASLGKKLDRVRIAAQNLFIMFGEELSPEIGKLAEKIANFDASSMKEELRVVAKLAGIVVDAFELLGKIIPTAPREPVPPEVLALAKQQRELNRLRAAQARLEEERRRFELDQGGITATDLENRPEPEVKVNKISTAFEETEEKVTRMGTTINRQFEKMDNKSQEVFDSMQVAVTGWASSFSRDLTDVLFGAELSFGKILESFARMITEMFIQLTIIKPLMDAVFGFFAPTTSVFNVGTSAGTQIMASSPISTGFDPLQQAFGGTFAEGGVATRPTFGTFGEAGPEALIPLDRFGDFGGGSNVEINIIGAPEGTRTEESELGNGGRRVDVIIDEKVATAVQPGSESFKKINKAFNNLTPALVRR